MRSSSRLCSELDQTPFPNIKNRSSNPGVKPKALPTKENVQEQHFRIPLHRLASRYEAWESKLS